MPGTRNVIINNVWNKQHASGYASQQCILKRCTNGGQQYGWTWDWPPLDRTTSFASPEIVFGRKPWDGGASTTPDLPKTINALGHLNLDFSVEITAVPSYNLNATMWLTRTGAAPTTADPENIVAEVMVRFDDPANLGGCCVSDGTATLGNYTFDVYHQDAHADASGGSSYTWKMVIYEGHMSTHAAQLDLALVLKDMVTKGLADSSQAAQGVELITEVSGDQGELWLNRFDVTVE